jgi:hypothetical protein
MENIKTKPKSLKARIVFLIVVLIVAASAYAIHSEIKTNPSARLAFAEITGQTVVGSALNGDDIVIDMKAIESFEGYGESLKTGEVVPISKDDKRLAAYEDVAIKWVELTENRSYETIVGDEEYSLYTLQLTEWLNEQNDIEETKAWYVDHEYITEGDNIKVTTVVIDQIEGARVVVESDCTLVAAKTIDELDAWKKVGDVKHNKMEFYIIDEDKDGVFLINGFKSLSEWRQENTFTGKLKAYLFPEIDQTALNSVRDETAE